MPRFLFEALAFGGVLIVLIYTISISGNFVSAIPLISLFVFAGYRLLPASQMIYRAITQVRFILPVLDAIHSDLNDLSNKITKQKSSNLDKISFDQNINLVDITYKYPGSNNEILKNLNLSIKAKSTIGIVGKTASGKTTIVDIILNLLEPSKGALMIDNKNIKDLNEKSWQEIIGYIPQNIYLIDDTVRSNIAFGIKKNEINHNLVLKAAKASNLDEIFLNELEKGIDKNIGEKGIKLSGGQRQRIGIARALYNQPKILIMDEATNALDSLTEDSVMQCIRQFNKKMTIIIIAHRLNNLKECDEIVILEDGKIKDKGKFDELQKKHDLFNSTN